MVGEVEELHGQLQLYPHKIVQGQVTILLTAEDGKPKWSGQGAMKHHGGAGCCGR